MQSPDEIAAGGSESQQQQAFMAWCAMAAAFGIVAADDALSWKVKGHARNLMPLGPNAALVERLSSLHWIHSIPNGGSRGDTKQSAMLNGAIMKQEGVKKGVLDVFLPFPCQGFAGLYIEMKVGRNKLSPEQEVFSAFVKKNGYAVAVCYNWKEAVSAVKNYLEIKNYV